MEETKYYDLTESQNLMYFTLKRVIKKSILNIGIAVWFEEEIDIDLLEQAAYKAIWRMDALRLRLKKVDGVIKQYVSNEEIKKIPINDFTHMSKAEIDSKLEGWTEEALKYKDKEMYDVQIIKASNGVTGIYIKVNHVIMDAWGLSVYAKDVIDVYLAMKEGKELPEAPAPYMPLVEKDLAYMNSKRIQRDEEFWKEYFNEAPKYSSVSKDNVGKKFRPYSLKFAAKQKTITVDQEKVAVINQFCRENRISPQNLFLLGSQLYLFKLNNTDESLVNSVLSRRSSIESKRAGGMMVNTLNVKVKCPWNLTFLEACNKITMEQYKLLRHGDYSFTRVLNYITETTGVRTGIFTDFTITYQPAKIFDGEKLKAKVQNYCSGNSGMNVYLTIMDAADIGTLDFMYLYKTSIISEEAIDELHKVMIQTIESGIKTPDKTIKEILEEVNL